MKEYIIDFLIENDKLRDSSIKCLIESLLENKIIKAWKEHHDGSYSFTAQQKV